MIIKDTEEDLKTAAARKSAAVVGHFSSNNLVNNAEKASLFFNNGKKADNITMEIAEEKIKAVSSEKLLGLQVSASMDWKTHIDKLLKKLNQRLGLLRRLKNKVPQSKLKIIAEAILTSTARYGIAVYYKTRLHLDPKCEEQTKLQVVQNKMFRILAGKKQVDKVRVEVLAQKLKLMSINQISGYHLLIETYNILNYGSSQKIRQKLTPASETSRYLKVPLFKKSSCRSFNYYASRLWNTLPSDIRTTAMSKENLYNIKQARRLNLSNRM